MKPNKVELKILSLAYGRFYDLFEEFINEAFWTLSAEQRLMKLKCCFEIYNELLKYEPIKGYIQYLKKTRPPQESFFAEEYFTFIRNILSHFPFFASWNDVYITNELSTWDNPKNSSISKFIKEHAGKECVKYRVWDEKGKKYTYMDINFPDKTQECIFVKDLISEKEGMLFCMVLMKRVLHSQVEYENPKVSL
jgi:hypothetical protein